MNEQTVMIPRHLAILGLEAGRLGEMLKNGLSLTVAPSRVIWRFRGYMSCRVDQICRLTACLVSHTNALGNAAAMQAGHLAEWRVRYALWRLRGTLLKIIAERQKLWRVKGTENQQKIAHLMAGIYDKNILHPVREMLADVADSISDPLEAMKRKGVTPNGDRLIFNLKTTLPEPDMNEFMSRFRVEFPQLDYSAAPAMPPQSHGKSIGTMEILLGGLLLGWLLSEIFDDDKNA